MLIFNRYNGYRSNAFNAMLILKMTGLKTLFSCQEIIQSILNSLLNS